MKEPLEERILSVLREKGARTCKELEEDLKLSASRIRSGLHFLILENKVEARTLLPTKRGCRVRYRVKEGR